MSDQAFREKVRRVIAEAGGAAFVTREQVEALAALDQKSKMVAAHGSLAAQFRAEYMGRWRDVSDGWELDAAEYAPGIHSHEFWAVPPMPPVQALDIEHARAVLEAAEREFGE